MDMLDEVECSFYVEVPLTEVDEKKQVPQSLIVTRLLKLLLILKSTEEHGYFIAVKNLKRIGTGKFVDSLNYVVFPVWVRCRTFLPVRGEIMHGVVYKVFMNGVFLRMGPMRFIYLSNQKMPGYSYVHNDQNPFFVSNDQSRIELDVTIRFMVFGTRWTPRNNYVEREYMILASLEGDCLGPMALSGHYDDLEFEVEV